MRLFVALNLPPDLRSAAWHGAEPLRAGIGPGVAWVGESGLHVTLRFLGDRPDDLVPRLVDGLSAAVTALERPYVDLGGVGAFPGLRRPNVLWLGIVPNAALAALYQTVDHVCVALGVAPEPRPFHPHVTLGRFRRGSAGGPGPVAIRQAADAVAFRASFVAETVDLMHSELAPAGARYWVLAAIPIGSRG